MRFPGFTDEWKKTTLGDIVQIVKDKISTSYLQSDTYISTENILPNFAGINDNCNIPDNQNVTRYKAGDILLANIRPYLKKIWLADRNGGCNADVFVFRPNNINSSFVYYSIANDKFCDYVMSGAKGVKMPRGDKDQILKFETGIPSDEEQQRVVQLLSLIDERIATQNKIIEDLQCLIKGLRELLFKPLLTNFVKLGNIAKITNGSGDVQDAISNYQDGLYPFFDRSDEVKYFRDYSFDAEAIIYAGEGAEFLPRYYNGKFALHQRCYAITTFSSDFLPRYIYHYLQTQNNYFIRNAVGSTVPSLRLDCFLKIGIPNANKYMQEFIVTKLDTLCEKIDNEKHLLSLYQKQKAYLLQELFI